MENVGSIAVGRTGDSNPRVWAEWRYRRARDPGRSRCRRPTPSINRPAPAPHELRHHRGASFSPSQVRPRFLVPLCCLTTRSTVCIATTDRSTSSPRPARRPIAPGCCSGRVAASRYYAGHVGTQTSSGTVTTRRALRTRVRSERRIADRCRHEAAGSRKFVVDLPANRLGPGWRRRTAS